ncbi:hypothetical protein Q8A67_011563 [Cirrhinus molitorella]|uniref:TRIM8/14/16/25/29/45/65 coiled-coil region domain-containing protein n=1 Tax=Cirrhinus molitorella TaxID=172907 RepID=A0AA88PVK9_9TELE|nr:hypothetical protein Q8A67_011563 [Cirrhinus molitorella]
MVKKQEELKKQKRDFTQKIKCRGKKVQAFRNAEKIHKHSAKAAVQHSDRTFNELISYFQKRRTEVRQMIRTQEKKAIAQTTGHMLELEQEISNLEQENDKLKLVLNTEDHIHFFQNYSSQSKVYVCTTSPRDVNDLLTFEKVEESVSELKDQLVKLCEEHMEKISKKVGDVHIFKTTRLQGIPVDSPASSLDSHSSDSEFDGESE